MKAVFADAFYFVALLNRGDQHHAKVTAAARQMRENLITTEWVLMEIADAPWLNPAAAVWRHTRLRPKR